MALDTLVESERQEEDARTNFSHKNPYRTDSNSLSRHNSKCKLHHRRQHVEKTLYS